MIFTNPENKNRFKNSVLVEDISEHFSAGLRSFIVAGGDGTINYAVNKLFENLEGVEIRIIPAGTKNDTFRFMKKYGLKSFEFPVFEFCHGGIKRYFINSCGFGRQSYKIKNKIATIFELKSSTIKIVFDREIEGIFMLGVFLSIPYFSGGLKFMDFIPDGSLKGFLIRDRTTPSILIKYIKGLFVGLESDVSFSATSFELYSRSILFPFYDGEAFGVYGVKNFSVKFTGKKVKINI